MPIPKLLHFISLEKPGLSLSKSIASWRRLNPDYDIMMWEINEVSQKTWYNQKVIDKYCSLDIRTAANIIGLEVLFEYGGLMFQPYSFCVRSLEEWLLEPSEFLAWKHERLDTGVIGEYGLGSTPGSQFIGKVVTEINTSSLVEENRKTIRDLSYWLTLVWKQFTNSITIYPAHFFNPNPFNDLEYCGIGPVFCLQSQDEK